MLQAPDSPAKAHYIHCCTITKVQIITCAHSIIKVSVFPYIIQASVAVVPSLPQDLEQEDSFDSFDSD